MLQFTIPASEGIDKHTGVVYKLPELNLRLEHSLISVSKWEAKWQRAYIGPRKKNQEMTMDYVVCMSLSPITLNDVNRLSRSQHRQIADYINIQACATTITDNTPKNRTGAPRPIRARTAEMIRDDMYVLGIYESAEKWHLNRLLAQIQVGYVRLEKMNGTSAKGGGKAGQARRQVGL